MTPTVTIALQEYETLKNIESAMMQKPFITYHYHHGINNTLMFIVNADDSTKKMIETINWLEKKASQLEEDHSKLRSDLLSITIPTTKWWQLWK